jgi:Domain of unknown function (DUF5916)
MAQPTVVFVCLVLLLPCPALAQQSSDVGVSRKQATAARVVNATLEIDGRLDEEAWRLAPPVSDFVQKEPTEGAQPTDPMEVWFLYDDSALYVGARMTSREGRGIQAPLGRRDNVSQAEHILVAFDTFLDRRTSVVFGVTAAGVRLDRFHATDNEESFDAGFDPVWEARTHVTDDGWTAELWIPFSQLRFNPDLELVWGLNIRRFRPTLDEQDYWILIPRTDRAWSSRFGELRGIANVPPRRRIELSPYVAGASTLHAAADRVNPFNRGANVNGRAGADLKIGLGPNLTLDATFNPDFGQVEADPAEVNLTAFETRFPEKRPFFLEGAPLFDIGHANFYYSRRIGARPLGPAVGEYVDYPSAQTIIGAAKLTGRLRSKTSIGLLSAVTDQEFARVASVDLSPFSRIRVAPHTFHSVGRVLQEFGPLGNTVGAFVNFMHRDLSHADPLASVLSENAFGVAGSTLLRFKGGEYEIRAAGGTSFVSGEAPAIERIQRSSAHYAQRPDRTYSRLDPTLTSLTGWSLQANMDRVSGRHWLWGMRTKIDSENFETNDIGVLTGADGLLVSGNLRYRETQPGRIFRSYSAGVEVRNDSTLRLLRQAGEVQPNASVTWANYWTTSIAVSRNFVEKGVSLTRGGPIMARAGGWSTSIEFGNRATSQTRWTGEVELATTDDGGHTRSVSTTLSFRPGPRWQLSASPLYERLTDTTQYVTTFDGGRAETYGSRYVFAFIDRSTVSTAFRLGLTLKPDMNLDVYAEPFAASGRYYDYGELLAPSTAARVTYGTSGTTLEVQADGTRIVRIGDLSYTLHNRDFNTLSFRSNVVLRWEWRPGSTLYLVWQQDRSNTERIGSFVGPADMFRSLTAPGRNIFVVKTSFWLPLG